MRIKPALAAALAALLLSGGDFLVADPMNGWRRVPVEVLMPSFQAMGRRAVALLRAD